MTLPTIFATLPGGNTPASLLDTNFSILEGAIVQPVTATGATNAYVLTPTDPWITGYSLYKGNPLSVIFPTSNTGAVSVNVSGLGAVAVNKNVGGTATPLTTGDIFANVPYILICDGATFWLSSSGGASSTVGATRAYNNLKITNDSGTPNTKIDVTAAGLLLTDTSGTPKFVSAVSVVIDCGTVGANGLDAGALANTTWYYVYVISNGTTTAGLASTSSTAPTLPSGYSLFMRVGAMVTDTSATFKRSIQLNNIAQYTVVTGSNTAALPTLASGSAGSVSTPTWVSVNLTTFVPATASKISVIVPIISGSGQAMVAPNNAYGAFNAATNSAPIQNNAGATGMQSNGEILLETAAAIFWASANTNNKLLCLGWIDNL